MTSDPSAQFSALFAGYPNAYGTAKGGWIHEPPVQAVYNNHLTGKFGIGVGPLLPDGTCWFAAIDLDRPDFAMAQDMASLLPGVLFIEKSRSGNAHVLAFFEEPIAAWIPRGIMREALAALGQPSVEVFPKTDRLLPGMVGNYLNLPYFGDTRPVVGWKDDEGYKDRQLSLDEFVALASANRNSVKAWTDRARWLGVPSPQERDESKRQEFGTQPNLHRCAEYVIAHRDDNPVAEGHRAVVFFSLAKMLCNWSEVDHDEALTMLALVNDSATDPISSEELNRILFNAERGQFTSTGCDDPLFLPFADPDCPIAHGGR